MTARRPLFRRSAPGFTLIELLVVILIIAILAAVAIASYLNQTSKAQGSAVQQGLAVSYTDAKADWVGGAGNATAGQSYGSSADALAKQLSSSEPQYTFVGSDTTYQAGTGTAITGAALAVTSAGNLDAQTALQTPKTVSVDVKSPSRIVLCAYASAGGTAFCEAVDETGALTITAQAPSSLLAPADADARTSSLAYATASTAAGAETSVLSGQGTSYWPQTTQGAAATITAPSSTANPQITGNAITGQTLTASQGTWNGSSLGFAYQWEDCGASGSTCTNITGATAQTYTPTSTDAGQQLKVVVSATNSAGTQIATSAASAAVQTQVSNTAAPTITGDPVVGTALTAAPGTWAGSPSSYAYQWQDCTGATCTNIGGATAQTYTPTSSDAGDTLRVMVTAGTAPNQGAAASAATTSKVVTATDEYTFETGTQGWEAGVDGSWAGASITQTTTAYTGSASLQVTTTGQYYFEGTDILLPNTFSIDNTYTAGAWVKMPAGETGEFIFGAEDVNESPTNWDYSVVEFTGTGSWQYLTTTWDPTYKPETPMLIVRTSATPEATTFDVDDATVEPVH